MLDVEGGLLSETESGGVGVVGVGRVAASGMELRDTDDFNGGGVDRVGGTFKAGKVDVSKDD